ncbi:hypothetical protein JIX56_32215 [Streptomyces sp. CA-210063]|uniref:hypothetical protein n=1 Tax=Streptomyces sp. CA-210063 TaxID=2801029 RepID=UPI00214C37EA|nr:hypothetical protein [Streptomyces sp. CA-210063]UUU34131.1 hypothetical protein JIX56_32215 [Streptomyces sp. CA-210063]
MRSADAWTSCSPRGRLHLLTDTHRLEEPQPYVGWGSSLSWTFLAYALNVLAQSYAEQQVPLFGTDRAESCSLVIGVIDPQFDWFQRTLAAGAGAGAETARLRPPGPWHRVLRPS